MEDSGKRVVEFNPRLFKRLQKENEELRSMIEKLIETVRSNERIHKNLIRIEEKILETKSLEELIRTLVLNIRRRFRIPFVTISIGVKAGENPIIPIRAKGKGLTRNLIFVSQERLEMAFPNPPVPVLKNHLEEDMASFFQKRSFSKISSIALIPLQFQGRLFGSLNLGSRQIDRFGPHQGIDLLDQFSKKISPVLHGFLENHEIPSFSKRAGEIIVAGGAVILNEKGEVLLVRQIPEMDNYWKGKWICPGGRIEPGETIEEAILREVEEETHLKIRLIRPIPPFERIVKEDGKIKLHVIYIDYLSELEGGELKPDDDVGEAMWVHQSELPGILNELHEDTRKLLRLAGIL
jgi:ADP-ribose pyrophosphatase YjhB (NUDIX family)/uncharacterized protein YigA (DUF484 family)